MKKWIYFFVLSFFIFHLKMLYAQIDKPLKISSEMDQGPVFPGENPSLIKYLDANVGYPKPPVKNGFRQNVVLKFVITRNGYVQDPKIIKGLTDSANQDALRVVRRMPRWRPAVYKNQPVNVEYTLSIPYTLKHQIEEPYFSVVEQMPTFPSGQAALLRFLSYNLKYPPLAKKNDVQGMIVVQFIVERDGSLTNLLVVKRLGSGCDEEALRLIKMMPKWQPGFQKGKPVRVQFNLPIRFKVDN